MLLLNNSPYYIHILIYLYLYYTMQLCEVHVWARYGDLNSHWQLYHWFMIPFYNTSIKTHITRLLCVEDVLTSADFWLGPEGGSRLPHWLGPTLLQRTLLAPDGVLGRVCPSPHWFGYETHQHPSLLFALSTSVPCEGGAYFIFHMW